MSRDIFIDTDTSGRSKIAKPYMGRVNATELKNIDFLDTVDNNGVFKVLKKWKSQETCQQVRGITQR